MAESFPDISTNFPPPGMSQHDWEMLSLSMSASAIGVTDPPPSDLPHTHIPAQPPAFPVPSTPSSGLLHDVAQVSGLGDPSGLTVPRDGSDEFPEPLSTEWKPHLSVSTATYAYGSQHAAYENEEYRDELHVFSQDVNVSAVDRESFLDPSELLSASESSIREFYLESQRLIEETGERTQKKDGCTRYRWWRRPQTSMVVWSVAVAATIVGVAVIGRSWQQERFQNEQLRMELSAKDEKLDYLLYQVNRLKEVLGGQHKVGIGAST